MSFFPDPTDRIDTEQTALQRAEDEYQEALHEVERLKNKYLTWTITAPELYEAQIRLTWAEADLQAEKQAAAARAGQLPF